MNNNNRITHNDNGIQTQKDQEVNRSTESSQAQARAPTAELELNNISKTIPLLGLGTFQIKCEDTCTDAVNNALQVQAYGRIDTAACYHNEAACMRGILQSKRRREEVFITSKLHPKDMKTFEKAFEGCVRSSNQFKFRKEVAEDVRSSKESLPYIDLYLIRMYVYVFILYKLL